MFRRHLFLVVVLLLLIAALVMPESRRLILLQVVGSASGRPYEGCLFGNWQYHQGSWLGKPVSLDRDWETCIALSRLNGSRALEYARKAVSAGPDRPEIYAAAMGPYCVRAHYDRPEERALVGAEARDAQKIRQMDPEIARALLELAERGSRLDPDNCFFELIRADVLYGLRRDAEALELVRSAARRGHYNSYCQTSGALVVRYQSAAGLPSMEACTAHFRFVSLPSWGPMRRVSRLTVWHATRLVVQGDSDRAGELLTAVVRIGGLMHRDSPLLVGRLIGRGVQREIRYIEPTLSQRRSDSEETKRIAGMLRARGWTDLAALWERESKRSLEFRRKVLRKHSEQFDHLMKPLVMVITASEVGYLCLQLCVVLVGAAGLAWLVTKVVPRTSAPIPGLGTPARLGLAILIALPWLAASTLAAFGAHGELLQDEPGMYIPCVRADSFPLFGLWLFLIWFAVWHARRMPRVGERMRGPSVILLGFAIFWALAFTALIVETVQPADLFTSRRGPPLAVADFAAGLAGIAVLLLLPALTCLAAWQARSIPGSGETGRRGAGLAVFIGTLALIPLVLAVYLVGVDWFAFGGGAVPLASVMLMSVLVAFVAGRVVLLRRSERRPPLCASVIHTVRGSSAWLGKVLLLLYFIILFGQLPLRADASERLRAIVVNEVEAVMSWPG